MSRGLTDGLLDEVIDDLGDRNGYFALEIILERLLQVPVAELDTRRLARIRDAALDNLDYALASHAQRALVGLCAHRSARARHPGRHRRQRRPLQGG